MAFLDTDLTTGLTSAEARQRLQQCGPNEVAERRRSPVLAFLHKFWGPTAWMIELIIILSWALQRYTDLAIVAALLIVNAVLSYLQEQRASAVVNALRDKLQVDARVLRDGQWSTLHARLLVPGDVVRLRAGDYAPADIHVRHGSLSVDQSALTGESQLLESGPQETVYAGSVVKRGEATGVVVLTGAATYFGRTVELVQVARPRLHIEDVVARLVRSLLVIVGVLLALTIVVVLARGERLVGLLPLLLVLLMGAVPVALPVMFTVSMALGSKDLASKNVLVTRLTASEDAATMDVLCVDKTGTITTNQLSVANVYPLDGYSADEVRTCALMASQAANQDPIDQAIIAEAERCGLHCAPYTQTHFAPFDPSTRRTEATGHVAGAQITVAKGAVAVIAELCGLGDQAPALEQLVTASSGFGHRALAVAKSDQDGALRLIGLLGLTDEVRPDAARFVAALQERGIAVKMLTGDALAIAADVAARVGLGTALSRAAEIASLAESSPAEAARLAEQSDGFAEIYPEGKYSVVRALQQSQHIVGMTGDGVNDAPALRQAEVGIAVSNASDVAKGAASVVLTAEGLASIVDLVDNGRQIHQRILTWVVNKVSRTILKTSFVVGAYLLTGQFVISALAMLLMVFMTDFVKISLSTDNVRGSRSPESWDIDRPVRVAVVLGVLMVLEAFALLLVGLRYLGLANNPDALHTFSFLILFFFAMFSILVVRERGHFWESRPSKTLAWALGIDIAVGTLVGLLGIPGMAPLIWWQVLLVLGCALFFSLLPNDLVKVWLGRRIGFAS